MSFGKNSQAIGAVGSFRQMSGAAAKHARPKKKGGGAPYFIDMFQPPLNELCLARLIPGEYLQDVVIGSGDDVQVEQVIRPFVKFVDHYDGLRSKGGICSAGPLAAFRDKRCPCYACDIYWATAARNSQGRFESSRMSRQDKYAFCVFDYSKYHKIEQLDRDTGKMRMNSKNEPYFNWVRCFGQTCDACRAGKESKIGHTSHWPINYTQLQVLRSSENDIGQSCRVCCQENCIRSLGWMCGNCGSEVVDMSTTQLQKDEILKLTDEPYGCSACQHETFLVEVYECASCARVGHQGKRASLFDVDLKLKLVPGGNNNSKTLQVAGWSAPGAMHPQFADQAKPIDLVARYAPTPLEKQAEIYGVTLAPAQPQQAPAAPQQPQFQQQAQRAPVTSGQPPQVPYQQAPQQFQPPMQQQQPWQPPPMMMPQPQQPMLQPPPMQQAPVQYQQPAARPYQQPGTVPYQNPYEQS